MLLDARPWYLDALRSSVLFLDDADVSRDAHADAERLDAATKSVMNASLVTLGELEAATAKEKHDDLQAHHIGIILVLREHLAQLDQLHNSMRSTRLNQLLARQRLYVPAAACTPADPPR